VVNDFTNMFVIERVVEGAIVGHHAR